jgi:hypothetical protein
MAQYASTAYQAAPTYSTVQVVQPATTQYMMQPVQTMQRVAVVQPTAVVTSVPSPPPKPQPQPQPIKMPGGFIPREVCCYPPKSVTWLFLCPPLVQRAMSSSID